MSAELVMNVVTNKKLNKKGHLVTYIPSGLEMTSTLSRGLFKTFVAIVM